MSLDSQPTSTTAAAPDEAPKKTVQAWLDEANRSFALKKWFDAVEEFGEALELLRQEHGEDSIVLAEPQYMYGVSLLEYAISQSSALGGGGPEAPSKSNKAADKAAGEIAASAPSSSTVASDPRFSFVGDAIDGDAEDDDAEDERQAEEEGEEEEDDFATAWEVLDFSRAQFEKIEAEKGGETTAEGKKARGRRVDCHMALGEISMEGEQFDAATGEYEAALTLGSTLYSPTSHRLAEVHYRLGLCLPFHSDQSRREEALGHIEKAREVSEMRRERLEKRKREGKREAKEEEASEKENGKGKGKAQESEPVDDIDVMEDAQVEKELKEVQEIVAELDVRLEEYKASPPNAQGGDTDVAQTIAESILGKSSGANGSVFPGATSGGAAGRGQVNDLSQLVRKKVAAAVGDAASTSVHVGRNTQSLQGSGEKRRVDESGADASVDSEKRAKMG